MAEITLDKSTTALLMADFSAGNMAQNPIVHERQTFERAGAVLAAATQAGVFVSQSLIAISPPLSLNTPTDNPRNPTLLQGAEMHASLTAANHPPAARSDGACT